DHKRRVHETLKRYACGACAYRCAESSNCASHRKAVHDPLKGVRCPHLGCTYADTRAVKQPRFLMDHCVAMGEGHGGYVRGADGDVHGDAGIEAWIEREKERVDGLRGVGVAGKRKRAVGVVEVGA
ncbi:zinc-finger protein, partial [Cryomyces antarcticus]